MFYICGDMNAEQGGQGRGYPRVHVPSTQRCVTGRGTEATFPFLSRWLMKLWYLFITNPSFLDPILPYTYMYIVIGLCELKTIYINQYRLVLHCNLYGPIQGKHVQVCTTSTIFVGTNTFQVLSLIFGL